MTLVDGADTCHGYRRITKDATCSSPLLDRALNRAFSGWIVGVYFEFDLDVVEVSEPAQGGLNRLARKTPALF